MKSSPATQARALALAVPVFLVYAGAAHAHGFAGKRFFPATLATEDPFVADELSLPTIERRKLAGTDEASPTLRTTSSLDFTKRITPNFGVGLGASYIHLRPDGGGTQRGFDNVAASVKYQFYKNDAHEAIVSAGLDWDIGGTGTKRVGAESFSTVTPTVFLGKGFGDLPDTVRYLRPFAVTAAVGVGIPTRAGTITLDDDGNASVERHPHVLNTGFSVQYSLTYLQSFVKDVGLAQPFNRMIPLVEFNFQTPLDRGGGATTGTINPGILWAGRYVQVGLEAVIPTNSATGGKVGVLGQLHFFLDDLFPRSIGKPLYGELR